MSKVTVISCSFHIKCLVCPPCCWTTHSSWWCHWPMARLTKRCDSLPHNRTYVTATICQHKHDLHDYQAYRICENSSRRRMVSFVIVTDTVIRTSSWQCLYLIHSQVNALPYVHAGHTTYRVNLSYTVRYCCTRRRYHRHHHRQPWAQCPLVSDAILTIAAHRCLSRAAWLNSCRVVPHHCSMSSDHSRWGRPLLFEPSTSVRHDKFGH